ncbi:MAG: DUF362 domain-containing protein [Candidatus Heimdallarchaeota archaeon]|nr:DUF362 domain-containing protein [Candidatus Heimdallarchaeota archaeon]
MSSRVAIVKVENDDVEKAVREAVELLGGLQTFIADFSEVILKPNLLSAPDKKEDREKIRTDPRVLEALVKMLLELKKSVVIGDTCGSGHSGGTREVLKNSGYLELGEKYENVDVRSLELNGPITIDVQGKKLTTVNISKDIVEAQAVINVPKMKTHAMTLYTGSIKNLYGTICGGDKTRIHSLGASIQGFSQCLVDLYAYEKPKIKLNVMDAIVALEGMGPGASGKAVHMNLILASDDAVALDAVAFTLMGHEPSRVPTIKYAAEQNLGIMDLTQIEIIGEKIETHKKKFKLPRTAKMANIPFQKFTTVMLRVPKYVGTCNGCLNCVRGCPESVIKMTKTKTGKPKPVINYKGCISCFTCLEVCPEACYDARFKNLAKVIAVGLTVTLGLAGLIIALALLIK